MINIQVAAMATKIDNDIPPISSSFNTAALWLDCIPKSFWLISSPRIIPPLPVLPELVELVTLDSKLLLLKDNEEEEEDEPDNPVDDKDKDSVGWDGSDEIKVVSDNPVNDNVSVTLVVLEEESEEVEYSEAEDTVLLLVNDSVDDDSLIELDEEALSESDDSMELDVAVDEDWDSLELNVV